LGQRTVNEFRTDLEYSLDQRENELFDSFYFRVFRNLKKVVLVSDKRLQMQGVDKKLIFESGKELLIDEKKRRTDYGDILLEEWSDEARRKIGWVGNPNKLTDYIVYAIMPTRKVYLFPYKILQLAWVTNYHKWKDLYRVPPAENEGYNTTNLAIPPEILMEALVEEMKKGFKAEDELPF